MELGGDEKRIRALFSELSLEDRSRVPQFAHMWTRAQQSALRSAVAPLREKSFIKPVAVLVSLFVTAAACSFAIWAWYKSAPSQVPNIVNRQPPAPNTPEVSLKPQPAKVVADFRPRKVRPRKLLVRQRPVDRQITSDAALLSSWQSPTQTLLESPTSLVLSSLPQLNQSATDLKSFLPKNNELIKESNQ
jgi:hypothetical protein